MATVSLIICTRDRGATLRATLASLSAEACTCDGELECLVVDNGSRDQTREVVEGAWVGGRRVNWVYEPRPGLDRARNRGIAASRGHVIVFIDDDARPAAAWLGKLVAPILDGDADAAAGAVVLAPHLERDWLTTTHRGWLAVNLPDPSRPQLVGANMAFHRRVLDRVPLFDPELDSGALGFAGDTLFGRQISAAGFRVAAAPGAVVEHHCDADRLQRASFLASATRHGRSMAYIAHHWEHRDLSGAAGRAAVLRQRLRRKRLTRPWDVLRREGCAMWEMMLVQEIAFWEQALVELRRPRRYDRHGLRPLEAREAA